MAYKRKINPKSAFLIGLKKSNKLNKPFKKGLLLDVFYDGYFNKNFMKFYDFNDSTIKIVMDYTNFRPYCYTQINRDRIKQNLYGFSEFDSFRQISKINPFTNKPDKYFKIHSKTPYGIGGGNQNIKKLLGERSVWEANIPYHHNFIYDRNIIIGMIYKFDGYKLIRLRQKTTIDKSKLNEVFKGQSKEFKDFGKRYLDLFFQPIPDIFMMAFDIEVELTPDKTIPNVDKAEQKVISISIYDSDDDGAVLVLDDEGKYRKNGNQLQKINGIDTYFYEDEKKMLNVIFTVLANNPVIITHNGGNFDFPYLYNRAIRLGILPQNIPFRIRKGYGIMARAEADLFYGIHIDTFTWHINPAIRTYAHQAKYDSASLSSVSKALLGEDKVAHEEEIDEMPLEKLVEYNFQDSKLTNMLMRFNDSINWKLMILFSRISRLPIISINNRLISAWIRSLVMMEHRARKVIIPNHRDMKHKEAKTKAIIADKKYHGALVIEPKVGRHYKVKVMDFTSLYPSIMNEYNLSYETLDCGHKQCKIDGKLPDLPYYSCQERQGILSYIVGFFRFVRSEFFKPLGRTNEFYKVIEQALKVFINGSYGVMGSENFQLFDVGVAECTTGLGRHATIKTIEKAESLGVNVIYGDTDSVFLKNISNAQTIKMIEWSREQLRLELEDEKTFQFLALSNRKKNYIGIKMDGKVEIKGLMAKKSNTPQFIKDTFELIKKVMVQIKSEHEFFFRRKSMIGIIKKRLKQIGTPAISLENYVIQTKIGKRIKDYEKLPQHIVAAKLLMEKTGKSLDKGDYIRLIKTRHGALPLELAKPMDINIKKYKGFMRSVFEQIFDALGIKWHECESQTSMDAYF